MAPRHVSTAKFLETSASCQSTIVSSLPFFPPYLKLGHMHECTGDKALLYSIENTLWSIPVEQNVNAKINQKEIYLVDPNGTSSRRSNCAAFWTE